MKKCLTTAMLVVALSANMALPGFVSPADAAQVKCRPAAPPKGLKRTSHVRSMRDGRKYQFSDRPGWIYALLPKKGWVVMKCFGAWN